MKRGENSKIYKKAIIVAMVAIVMAAGFYISTYTPVQIMEVGEYKNYKLK